MRLRSRQEIPIEVWIQTCGDINNFIGKNILHELCKGIADIIANGGEYIIRMTDAEITSQPMTNSMRYQREVNYRPLVRCKDCKYYNKGENERESWEECNRTMKSTSADDFCSWAKMKGGK